MVKYFIISNCILVPRLEKADNCIVLICILVYFKPKNNKLFGFICLSFSEFVKHGLRYIIRIIIPLIEIVRLVNPFTYKISILGVEVMIAIGCKYQ